jgi:hypothetical protein
MSAKAPPSLSKRTPKPSMPPRGKRPGHKQIKRTGLRYWYASQVRKNTMGYPDQCIALPLDADDETIDRLCQDHTADLLKWIDERTRAAAAGEDPGGYNPRRVYDGTVRSVLKIYQEHPKSKFHRVKSNTRRTYSISLKLIESDCGQRLIRNLSVVDVEGWYDAWRAPARFIDQDGVEYSDGRERVDRAHDGVGMFKTALRFCAALHLPSREQPHCKQLADELEQWQFERGGARDQELTFPHVSTFVRTALDLEARGVIPGGRGLSMAISVASAFELMGCRQKDIIGEHAKNEADLRNALARGATAVTWDNGDVWTGYYTWENVPGWIWRVKTSKSKYRHVAEFDLTKRSLLFPLLERVPHAERTGAIIKGEGGLPIRERSHRKWFRQIALAAGIPPDIWHYDARAGSATEAEASGADLELIRAGMGHADGRTTLRYIRRRGSKLDELAAAREAHRAKAKESK